MGGIGCICCCIPNPEGDGINVSLDASPSLFWFMKAGTMGGGGPVLVAEAGTHCIGVKILLVSAEGL